MAKSKSGSSLHRKKGFGEVWSASPQNESASKSSTNQPPQGAQKHHGKSQKRTARKRQAK